MTNGGAVVILNFWDSILACGYARIEGRQDSTNPRGKHRRAKQLRPVPRPYIRIKTGETSEPLAAWIAAAYIPICR
jgi:hypothetical protein